MKVDSRKECKEIALHFNPQHLQRLGQLSGGEKSKLNK